MATKSPAISLPQRRVTIAPSAIKRDFFVYPANFLAAIAPGGAGNVSVQVQADAAFELQKLSFLAVVNGTNVVDTAAQFTIQITDGGTGRKMFSSPVALAAIFGNGQIPFILPTSKLFSENASIVIDVVNVHPANTYASLRLALIGTKIFKFGN